MNLILIVMDSLRYDHIGYYGNNWIKTPNIDSFASESVVFENAYPEGIPTIPVRTSLMTGNKTLNNRYWQALTPEDVTMAEILDEYNYINQMITDCFHLWDPNMNFHRGFHGRKWIRGQEVDSYRTDPHNLDITQFIKPEEQKGDRYVRGLDQYLRNTQDREKEEEYFAAQVMIEAANWLDLNHNHHDPFFLYVDSFDPHEPWDSPPPFNTMYTDSNYKGKNLIWPKGGPSDWLTDEEIQYIRALYAGEVSFADKWFGFLLNKIRELGLFKNSMIILVSDHGLPIAEHGLILKFHDPLYNELLKIPLMIHFPEGKHGGKRINALAEVPDILPTILHTIGHENDTRYMNGKSLLPLIEGKTEKIHDYVTIGAFGSEARCIRNENWSFILRPKGQPNELYDLVADPTEINNLIETHTEKVEEMERALSALMNIRLQKIHWLQLRYDVPGLSEGPHPPYANWKK